jgi:hypothetical protein|nr:MAG TPA: DNA REPAIR PROTEIN RAD52 HOMOLOG-BINDING PROTEIN, DNA REPAIR, DNA.7A [Caudoviricetes sp.]
MNEKLEFRLLRPEEIDCRIATINEKGLTLLLYKDARVDQNILDETVGPMGWTRDHKEIKGNMFCCVSLWDQEKQMWISKCDCGVESYTEKQKGEASDSFKRACFNWGIGRELYSAPSIWISARDCNITVQGEGAKKSYRCNDKFQVRSIRYDENRQIIALEIIEARHGKRVYPMPGTFAVQLISQEMIHTIKALSEKKGVNIKSILYTYGLKCLEEMEIDQFKDAMERFGTYPDKTPEDLPTTLPDEDDERLPFK